MGYIYVVSTINFDNGNGKYSIPVLGVHTSHKSALRHWKSVVENRQKLLKVIGMGGLKLGNRHKPYPDPYLVLAEMDFPEEKVRLEKWRTK